jgi:hypothetical protein
MYSNIEKLTKEDIKVQLKQLGVSGYSNKNKDELVNILSDYITSSRKFKKNPIKLIDLVTIVSCNKFKLNSSIIASAINERNEIHKVPKHLIKKAIDKGILCNRFFDFMNRIKLLEEIFPDIVQLKKVDRLKDIPSNRVYRKYNIYNPFEHTLKTIEFLPKTRIMKWSGLFHDIGKYKAFMLYSRSRGHEVFSLGISVPIMKEFGFTPREIRIISKIIEKHLFIRNFNQGYDKGELDKDKVKKFALENKSYMNYLIDFAVADIRSSGKYVKQELNNQREVVKIIKSFI